MMLAFWSETNFDNLPTTTLLLYLGSKFDPSIGQAARSTAGKLRWTYLQIAHGLWALVAALLGGALARLLFVVSERPHEPTVLESNAAEGMRLKWLRRPALFWLSGMAVVGLAAAAGSRAAPGLWAGVVFLLTCGLLGLATLGCWSVEVRGMRSGWGLLFSAADTCTLRSADRLMQAGPIRRRHTC